MSWFIPRNKLTPDQLRAVELPSNNNCIIKGSPGSGKSAVMLHRAKHLLESQESGNGRFLILVYTNVLKSYIKSAIQDLKLSENSVWTLDSWCKNYYRSYIKKPFPMIFGEKKSLDFCKLRQEVLAHISNVGYSNTFQFTMVDEGQDIEEIGYRIIVAISRHTTVFMDHKQEIYEFGSTPKQVNAILGASSVLKEDLLPARRCTPYIVQIAAMFISDELERKQWIAQNSHVAEGERQKPVLYISDDHDDEMRHLADAVRTRIDKNERIAILFPSRRHAFGVTKGLRENGLEVELPEKNSLNFETMTPKALVYPSAKGLTFDSVFMPMLNKYKFPSFLTDDLLEKWLFVGLSRAMKWVYISSRRNQCCFIDRFELLESQGNLTILNSNQTKNAKIGMDKTKDDEDELDDYF